MVEYGKVTSDIIKELCEIVGERNVLFGDVEALEMYSHDEIPDPRLAFLPDVVVRPASAQEISRIMKLANRERIPVTPRGAGSGESGGAIPVCGGIVLLLDRMNHILEVDRSNMVVVVEPGVITSHINETLKNDGLFFAGYTADISFIGGNIAENAGGVKAIKYGVTDRYVLGLEVVLPDGEIVMMGGKCVKDVAGYNLVHMMVGSEGTLGIFTKIILRLLPIPTQRVDMFVLFKDVSSAIGIIPEIVAKRHIIPAAIEFMDRVTLEMTCTYLKDSMPYQEAGAALLIEVDGTDEEQVTRESEQIGELCLEWDALEVFVGMNSADQERMWAIRHGTAEAFRAYSLTQCVEDIVVPIAKIPDIIVEVEKLSQKHHIMMPCYGHAGDGNLHVTFINHPETPIDEWYHLEHAAHVDLYRCVADMGGSISGEHGIGSKRCDYLGQVMDARLIQLQKDIKMVFDPNNVLNPGKIFPWKRSM